MNQHLQKIKDFIEQLETLSAEEKAALAKTVKNIDTDFSITEFKLDRTEKVKRTTAILLEETIEELEQKRKSVEDKNRDLEIEASLERMRTVAMGMRTPDDLLNICKALFNELRLLEFDNLRNVIIHTYPNEKDHFIDYDYSDFNNGHISHIPFSGNPILEKFVKEIRKTKDAFAEIAIKGDELKEWQAFRDANNEVPDERLSNATSLYYYIYAVGEAAIGISTFVSVPVEKQEVLKRFRNVFDLAYRRYIDITKAKEQAWEAEVQLALERVRARTMAMHHSVELADTASVLFEQIKGLGFETWSCGFCIWKKNNLSEVWMAADSGGLLPPMLIPYMEEPTHRDIYEASLSGETHHEKTWEGNELAEHYTFLRTIPSVNDAITILEDSGLALPSRQCYYVGFFKQGYLLLITKEPKLGANELSKRFASVFEQTYTRFLDLQKAEAQAREAQIEIGLERVRAKAMSMHTSNDLDQAINVFYEELRLLSATPRRCGLGLMNKSNRIAELSTMNTTEDGEIIPVIGASDTQGHPVLDGIYNNWLLQKEYHTVLHNKEVGKYYQVIRQHIQYPNYPTDIVQYGHFFPFHDGMVFAWTDTELPEDELQIYRRFTSVISLTYRRYKDIKEAEAQAREAQIEAALERVRSRTLAMQKSNDLVGTSAELFRQMMGLGIAPNRLYIGIISEENTEIEFWITDEDGSKVSNMFTGNAAQNPSMKKMHDGWKAHEKSIIIDMHDIELTEYFHYLGEELHVPFKDGLGQKRRLQYISFFSNGFIGMASPDEQPQETINLLDRFAYVFNLIYARFNDLKIAELHAIQAEQDLIEIKGAKKRAEEALTNLKAAQKQLIQSEKMASLGELTAGIAHEIQNPLNFVNNFSEVSIELLEELQEEARAGHTEDVIEIALGLTQNLQKINHHGKRADGIVKGMLQHSRSSAGEKQPTNLNAIADEFFKLSYHGLRAKDKTFNADLVSNFDNSLPKINAIPQDIGRVLLNLFNNAFYAVNQKAKIAGADYKPEVSVTTSTANSNVIITVKDNGVGIPEIIKDKIMQPFFTTKPTGEGTGLGLSLTYDMVVKGHGGKIDVETKEKGYTEFKITLPINS